jgi:hypothetical protein
MALPQTKVRVFAFSQGTGLPVPGIAATITAKWARDYGALNPLADTNPTEAEDGYYYFDLSINERNLTTIGEIFPKSSTSGIRVIGVPSFVTPKPWIEVPAKVRVFAYNVLTGEPEVGGQLKITAKWAKDYESAQPLTDINPVEVEGEEGYYYFDLTNDERDVEIIGEIFAESETNNVHVVGLPEFFILDPTSNRARERRDVPIVRSINDNLPISFLWPTADATFVVRRSINDAVFEAASGTVGTALRQEGSRWRYQLSYNAADRPAAEGKAQYELTAGGRTRFVELRVEVGGGGGDATLEKQDEILAALEEQSSRPVVVVIPAIEADSLTADSGKLIRYRGTLWSIAVQGLLAIPDKCYFTVKRDDEPDNKSAIQIVKSNPADVVNDGLKILAGSVAANLAHGSITFESYVESDVTKYRAIATVQAEATAMLKVRDYRIDFKDTADDIVLAERELRVVAPVTAATT